MQVVCAGTDGRISVEDTLLAGRIASEFAAVVDGTSGESLVDTYRNNSAADLPLRVRIVPVKPGILPTQLGKARRVEDLRPRPAEPEPVGG